jgi:RluA family pseudouridine synthase
VNNLIIHEEAGFLAVNKPAGVLSQKDKSRDPDLAEILQKEFARKGKPLPFLAPVHRLDRNTSGMILLAKTPTAARELTEWLQEGRIHRTYLAVVKGDPGERGRYEFRLRKNEKTNEVFVDAAGDEAVTEFTRERKMGNSSLVRVRLLTGRSHQIRVHFAHAGHALLGDKKYAKKPWSEIFGRPALHAVEVELPESDSPETLKKFTAPLPQDMKDLLQKLGGNNR